MVNNEKVQFWIAAPSCLGDTVTGLDIVLGWKNSPASLAHVLIALEHSHLLAF